MKDFIKTLLRVILPLMLVLVFGFIFMKFISLFVPFIIAWLISFMIVPLTKKINSKLKLKSKFLNKIIILLFIVGIIALITLIICEICNFIPQAINYCISELSKLNINLDTLSPYITDAINFDIIKKYITQYSSQILDASGKLLNIASNVPQLLIKIIVTIMAAYYFVSEEFDFNHLLTKIMPESFFKNYNLIKNNAKTMFVQYFVAQLKISSIILIILVIGFLILGIDNFFIIALLTTFLDLLPIFGTGAILWPWSLYHAIAGNFEMAIGLIIVYVVSQGFRQLIQPKLISDTVGISSLATLLFMYIGFIISGIGGMIIAVPVGVFCLNLIKAGILDGWINDVKNLILLVSNFLNKNENN